MYESSPSSSDGQPTYDAQTPVESVFTHPIIGVEEEGKDLYDCLAELYLGGSAIEYEGKKGYMMDLMDEFPPMLYIQMRVSNYGGFSVCECADAVSAEITIRSSHRPRSQDQHSYKLSPDSLHVTLPDLCTLRET